jgi:hypothetical protein
MELFYRIVLGTALVILIICLTYIGIVMGYYKKGAASFPPSSSTCPDYWTYDGTTCSLPDGQTKNKGNDTLINPTGITITLGTNPSSFNPTDSKWSVGGTSAICNKRIWANQNNIVWDGVTNYTGC